MAGKCGHEGPAGGKTEALIGADGRDSQLITIITTIYTLTPLAPQGGRECVSEVGFICVHVRFRGVYVRSLSALIMSRIGRSIQKKKKQCKNNLLHSKYYQNDNNSNLIVNNCGCKKSSSSFTVTVILDVNGPT